uniref:Uncharacterized protein n=1 Tax=Candidatus Kentrum sp. LPFa TaxID=2126335 RepID=A0A450WFY3_9GAMM|nr:MAG: hypothetical protein BECKLPF1236B_GA0070989_10864 [Candidatus Kentron sp. LPFa]
MKSINSLDEPDSIKDLSEIPRKKILREEILTGIPKSDLLEVVADFRSENAQVSTKQGPDGNWTLTAIFEN